MSCVICGGETKKTHKHKLFKTEIVSCSRCDFSFESNNNLSTTNTLLHQKQSVNSFGQNYRRNDYYIRVLKKIDKEIAETLKSLEYQIEDIVDAIQMDMYYGYITQDRGKYYINQVYMIKHRHQHMVQDMWKQRNITLGEHQAKLN